MIKNPRGWEIGVRDIALTDVGKKVMDLHPTGTIVGSFMKYFFNVVPSTNIRPLPAPSAFINFIKIM